VREAPALSCEATTINSKEVKEMAEEVKKEQPQPLDLDTGERLATTGRVVAQGIARGARRARDAEGRAPHENA